MVDQPRAAGGSASLARNASAVCVARLDAAVRVSQKPHVRHIKHGSRRLLLSPADPWDGRAGNRRIEPTGVPVAEHGDLPGSRSVTRADRLCRHATGPSWRDRRRSAEIRRLANAPCCRPPCHPGPHWLFRIRDVGRCSVLDHRPGGASSASRSSAWAVPDWSRPRLRGHCHHGRDRLRGSKWQCSHHRSLAGQAAVG